MASPRPKIVSQVCSVCGLDWQDHGKAPTLETCIKLLLDEVRALESRPAPRPNVQPYYYPVPYYPRPYWPTWYGTYGVSTGTSGTAVTAVNYGSTLTPTAISLPPKAST